MVVIKCLQCKYANPTVLDVSRFQYTHSKNILYYIIIVYKL